MNWEGEAVGGNLVICRVVSERDKLLSHNLITLVPPLFNEHGCTELLFLTNKNKILLRVLLNSCVVPPQFLTCAPSVQWIWMHGTFVLLIKICFLFYYFLCCGVMPSTQDRVFPRVFLAARNGVVRLCGALRCCAQDLRSVPCRKAKAACMCENLLNLVGLVGLV